ncbi:MAG: hypothetical protein EBU12_06480 [Microbacteriaceae bacterium]|nr:hypothetical protein [Microbacteriaceae bacterium]
MAKQTFTTGQVLTAAQVNSLQANDFNQTVSVKTANYTLVAADKGTRIEFNTSGSVTCTVNSGLFDAGDTLVIQNRGAGTATITAGTATVNTSASLALTQYSSGTLYFISNSAALFFGDAAGISASIVDAKGDLIVGTADNTVGRLAVGTNGYTLVADSSQTTGLAYSAGIPVVLNAQTATYTVVLGDAYKLVTMSVASANNFQIPTNANVAFPTGTVINVIQIGAGQTTIQAVTSGTTTVLSTGATSTAPKLRVVNSVASCVKIATDTWLVTGDVA